MTAFDRAWALMKMPFVNRGLKTDKLYQGRRHGEKDTGFWTPHKDKAVAYALFGRRDDYDDEPWVDPNVHIPELYSVNAPQERINLPLDMDYVGLGDASGAVDRRRVAFEDKENILPSFNPVKMPDEEMARIIERILMQGYNDDGDFMAGGEIPKRKFERIFDMKDAFRNWEGMYVDNDYKEDMEDSELYDSLSIQYDEGNEIDWDSLATTLGNVKGGDLRPFISRLRFADAMGLRKTDVLKMPARDRRYAVTNEDVERIQALTAQGMSQAGIARLLNEEGKPVSVGIVHYWANEASRLKQREKNAKRKYEPGSVENAMRIERDQQKRKENWEADPDMKLRHAIQSAIGETRANRKTVAGMSMEDAENKIRSKELTRPNAKIPEKEDGR